MSISNTVGANGNVCRHPKHLQGAVWKSCTILILTQQDMPSISAASLGFLYPCPVAELQ